MAARLKRKRKKRAKVSTSSTYNARVSVGHLKFSATAIDVEAVGAVVGNILGSAIAALLRPRALEENATPVETPFGSEPREIKAEVIYSRNVSPPMLKPAEKP